MSKNIIDIPVDIYNICMNLTGAYDNPPIVMPPWGRGSKNNPEEYELFHVQKYLKSVAPNTRCVAIIPQNVLSLTNSTDRNDLRNQLLQNNTLECVITIGSELMGSPVLLMVICTSKKHDFDKECVFVNLSSSTTDLDILANTSFEKWGTIIDSVIIRSKISYEDEWFYAYYQPPIIPSRNDFIGEISSYIMFKINSCLNKRAHLFQPLPYVDTNRKRDINLVNWSQVPIADLFEIVGAKRSTADNPGAYPYVTTQTIMNGHAKYVDFCTEDGNCISIESTASGQAFYQEYPFAASDHVEILKPKFKMNTYIALFIISSIHAVHSAKFSTSYKANKSRMQNEKIYLPVKSDGNCDFEFMEHYAGCIYNEIRTTIRSIS